MSKKQRRTKLVDGIAKSIEKYGQFYPILVDEETGDVLDGRKRAIAIDNPDIKKIKTESPEHRMAIKYHTVWFRQQLDKKKILTEVAEETGWRGLEPFAEFFGVTEQTISKHLPQKYKLQIHKSHKESNPLKVEKVTKKAVEKLKEVEKTLDAIAEDKPKLKESIEEVRTTLESFQSSSKEEPSINEKISQWIEDMNPVLSTWESHYERPLGFGDKDFHGNCSPVIIMALLERYSFSTQTILDPMAGSGTFGDVAKAMGYKKFYMSDIRPLRDDIEKRDASNTEFENDQFDFIFAHFPYWKLVEYTTDDPLDASRFTYEEFLEWSEQVFVEMRRILRKKGHLVVMIGNLRQSGVVDLEAQLSILGSKYFKLWDKIVKKIRPWSHEKRGSRMQTAVMRAKSQNRTMVNHDVILVFRND